MTEFDTAAEEIVTTEPPMSLGWKIVSAIVVIAVVFFVGRAIIGDTPSQKTEFSAVRLTNGEMYYGKLSGLGSKFPVMTEVFTIVQKFDPASGQGGQVMVPRGNEFHSPKQMIVNSEQILFVESVAANSQVGQLIKMRPR